MHFTASRAHVGHSEVAIASAPKVSGLRAQLKLFGKGGRNSGTASAALFQLPRCPGVLFAPPAILNFTAKPRLAGLPSFASPLSPQPEEGREGPEGRSELSLHIHLHHSTMRLEPDDEAATYAIGTGSRAEGATQLKSHNNYCVVALHTFTHQVPIPPDSASSQILRSS